MPSGRYDISEETKALQEKPEPDTRLHVGVFSVLLIG
ncbi:unnamed protein product [Toxocara canis]|uniref:Energy transducer TonB n=1 Tax=Toxocara canis TaxID=6265 RepID=A0A183VH80_TOXCA|nr:unnamed protein product [Toxocara canis]